MKKLSLFAAVLLAFAMLVSCATQAPAVVETEAVEVAAPSVQDAAEYLKVLYNKASLSNPAPKTSSDFDVVDIVRIGTTSFDVVWSADTELISFIAGENHKVTVKLPEECPETVYNIIATITDGTETAEVLIPHTLPEKKVLANPSYEEIVALAYGLEAGQTLQGTYRLYGTVVAIPTAWSDQYKNITVNMQIGSLSDQIIQCYRLAGDGCENLQVGDKITVEGSLTRYKDTYEFAQGCKLIGFGEYPDQSKLVEAVYQLEVDDKMKEPSILMGEIVKIPTAWSDQYGNITVDFAPYGAEDKIIEAYRLKGEGASTLAVGDKIAVYGTIKRYKDTREFDSGCVLFPVESYSDIQTLMTAYKQLEDGKALDCQRTLTGVITAINTAYSEQYGNITVTMVCGGIDAYPIQCYRLKGDGAATLAIGDTITVTGIIKNYKGTIEFDSGCTLI